MFLGGFFFLSLQNKCRSFGWLYHGCSSLFTFEKTPKLSYLPNFGDPQIQTLCFGLTHMDNREIQAGSEHDSAQIKFSTATCLHWQHREQELSQL